MMTPAPVSVIIPCFRDETALGELLAQLQQLTVGTPPLQVLVVDGAQSPLCRDICQRHGAQWLPAQPCRGEQLRLGASQAQHQVLWFLHADAKLQGNPLPAILEVLGAGAVGGYFAFRFAGQPCWQSRLLERLIALRNIFGVPYGDQGLFFDSSTYQSSGQHSPWPLFEEVELIKHARLLGRLAVLPDGVRVDARRWQRDGWWRRSLRNRWLALGYFFGVSPQRLAQRYSTVKASEDRTKS
ncbi:TIGR04283 family arsenosugar biosynthesis glycosyltransferase [Aquipseudomonas alcaligenes]|jgi:rSAM/selenodomain-associated transferase 2|uniref:TIGR04283 family arsenosugar biosynthesis glycosyltransferase n=1 Tax=Aquipseudomonas alcaligenes TaxID=43263 RepID=UPI001F02D660|nr:MULTISPECIES: TIGR04283 family arsenosugar biosynthesis glycosyltransferase [Pseudomonas]